MNAVGIDVSKGKSMVAIVRPFGEIVKMPFVVTHTDEELGNLARTIRSLDGETRVVMEYTGRYHEPIAFALHNAGIFVSAIHAKLIHDYGNDTIRRAKTDKKDALKIASYTLDKWVKLEQYIPQDDVRRTLKTYNRQYNQYNKLKVILKNNLIAILDQTFPYVNTLFSSTPRKDDGHEKWVDFVQKFWHRECIIKLSRKTFSERYAKWCNKAGYLYSERKAEDIYASASGHITTMPMNDAVQLMISEAVKQLNTLNETLAVIRREMNVLASLLPEYGIVMSLHGVGEVFAPQLMAEIGDVLRFRKRNSLACFAGIESPPRQSGKYEARSCRISKKGSAELRKTLFQVMKCLLQHADMNDKVFRFLDKKRKEGKPYRVYMIAGANKFLRIYYARVKEHLHALDNE